MSDAPDPIFHLKNSLQQVKINTGLDVNDTEDNFKLHFVMIAKKVLENDERIKRSHWLDCCRIDIIIEKMIQLIIYNILITLFKKESPGILPGLSAFINDNNLMCKLYTKYENQ